MNQKEQIIEALLDYEGEEFIVTDNLIGFIRELKPTAPKIVKSLTIDEDQKRDIAIRITNKLIELGYVKDCTDTDDEDEFEVQDAIVEILETI